MFSDFTQDLGSSSLFYSQIFLLASVEVFSDGYQLTTLSNMCKLDYLVKFVLHSLRAEKIQYKGSRGKQQLNETT